jgi:Glyoxalase-like domain
VASVIKTVTFDAADALALARFWAAALGSDVDEDSTPDKAFVEAAGWGGPNIWFIRVPEPKTAKNRMHFDLRAPALPRRRWHGSPRSAPPCSAACPAT